MLKPKVCRLRTSNLVGGWSMRYQLPWPAIKAVKLGYGLMARGRGHTVSAAQVVDNDNEFILFSSCRSKMLN